MIHQSVTKGNNLYAQDHNLWLEKTVYLLKSKNFSELELENLIE